MKKQYTILMIMFLMGIGASAQKKEYSGKMHVTPLALEQRGDSVYVKIQFDVSGVNVDSRRSISLIPTLVAFNNILSFPEVMIKGRQNYNIHRRNLSLMSKHERSKYDKTAPYTVLEGFKSENPKTVDYYTTAKYEPWMAEAKLDMYEDLCGCGNPPRRMGVSQLVNLVTLEKIRIMEAYSIIPYLAYVQPAVEAIKRRELSADAFLDFATNKVDIRPEYMNNPSELKKITNLISEIKNDKDITVRSINVIGYASPEGSVAGNQRLSEGRANALINYLSPRFDYAKDMYTVAYGGENWIGLVELVQKSDMPYKDAVLNIIETIPAEINLSTNTSRKKALMDFNGGDTYKYMLREFYPSLRKAICKIDFEVQNFDVNQAKEIIKTKPQNLSLNEMFLVANTYEKGSQDFIDLFETAVRLYPNDMTANLNAASAALARKDTVSAERYLDKIEGKTQSPEYYNALGTLLMLKGDYDKAQTALNKAANAGLGEALHNLQELDKKQNNINEIEQQKSKTRR